MTAGAAATTAPPAGAAHTRPPWLLRALGDAAGRGVHVAVVDSGLDPAWGDPRVGAGVALMGRSDRDFRRAVSADVDDLDGHGTACASILRSMAPAAVLHPVRVFHRHRRTSVGVLVAALEWAVEHRVQVVNLSLGTLLTSALHPLYRACEEAQRAGVVVVAAVEARTGVSLPAVFANTLGVTADRFADVHDYRYRPQAAVECVAQGRWRVRRPGGGTATVEATSYAAPPISALVALFLERHPGAGPDEVRELLARHALGGPGRRQSPHGGDET